MARGETRTVNASAPTRRDAGGNDQFAECRQEESRRADSQEYESGRGENSADELDQNGGIAHAGTVPTSAGRAEVPISSKDKTGRATFFAERTILRNRRRRVEVTTAGERPRSPAFAACSEINMARRLNRSGGSATSTVPPAVHLICAECIFPIGGELDQGEGAVRSFQLADQLEPQPLANMFAHRLG